MAKKPPAIARPVSNQTPGAIRSFDIPRAVSQAKPETSPAPIYANHIQVTAGASELLIDFFRLGPDPLNTNSMQATYLQRVIVPLDRAESIATAINMSVASMKEMVASLEAPKTQE